MSSEVRDLTSSLTIECGGTWSFFKVMVIIPGNIKSSSQHSVIQISINPALEKNPQKTMDYLFSENNSNLRANENNIFFLIL